MDSAIPSVRATMIFLRIVIAACFLAFAPSPALSLMEESSRPMPHSTLKDLLDRDFGLDLDIAGGFGQSREDPILVLSDTEIEAAHTELQVLRGIGKGRGILWRTIGTNLISEPSPRTIQRKIKTKDVRQDEIVETTENYYFSRINIKSDSHRINSQVIVYFDQKADIRFPYELGWLHFDNIVDYESREPGHGYSLAYNAPGVKATVYVYPIPQEVVSPSFLLAELERARQDIIRANGEDAIEHDWDIQNKEDHVSYYFIPRYESSAVSFVVISTRDGYIVKLRCTYVDDPLLREITNDFRQKLIYLVRTGTTAQTEDGK